VNSPHIRLQIDKITNKHQIENIFYINDIVDQKKTIKHTNYTKDKTIKDVSYEWVDNIKINEETDFISEIEIKSKMKETIEECFNLLQLNKK
jgi:hypothetical protein